MTLVRASASASALAWLSRLHRRALMTPRRMIPRYQMALLRQVSSLVLVMMHRAQTAARIRYPGLDRSRRDEVLKSTQRQHLRRPTQVLRQA